MSLPCPLEESLAANVQDSNSLPLLAHDKDSSSSLPPLATPAASASSSKQVASQASSKKAEPVAKSHEGGKENERPLLLQKKDQNEAVGQAAVKYSTSPNPPPPTSSQTVPPPPAWITRFPRASVPAKTNNGNLSPVYFALVRRLLEKKLGRNDSKLKTNCTTQPISFEQARSEHRELKQQINRLRTRMLLNVLKTEVLIESQLTLTDRSRLIKNRFSIDRCKIGGDSCEPADGDLRLVCGKCWEVAYCSRGHQRSDWKKHKLVCHRNSSHTLWLVAKKKSLDNANKSASIDDVD